MGTQNRSDTNEERDLLSKKEKGTQADRTVSVSRGGERTDFKQSQKRCRPRKETYSLKSEVPGGLCAEQVFQGRN